MDEYRQIARRKHEDHLRQQQQLQQQPPSSASSINLATPAFASPSSPRATSALDQSRSSSSSAKFASSSCSAFSNSSSSSTDSSSSSKDATPARFTLLTWNVDGIEDVSAARTLTRFEFALAIIATLDADVVCLQEVTRDLMPALRAFCVAHELQLVAPDIGNAYFCAVLVAVAQGNAVGAIECTPFPNSVMGRAMVRPQCGALFVHGGMCIPLPLYLYCATAHFITPLTVAEPL